MIEQIRLPRIIVGASVGMALGVAGATMQGLFRNPMADPGIIGVSAGGAVGAVVAIAAGLTGLFFLALPLFAFAGAISAAFLVYGIAVAGGRFSMATPAAGGRGRERVPGRGRLPRSSSSCPTTRRCARSCSGWRAGWTRAPGSTCASPRP